MVRMTQVLARVPVIKFRKGGLGSGGASSPAQAGAPQAAAAGGAPVQVQAGAPMSTSTIPDIDLPLRYKRAPLSDEEIAHINGGGIV